MPEYNDSEWRVEIWSRLFLDDDIDRAISLAVNENNPVPLIAIAFSGRADKALDKLCYDVNRRRYSEIRLAVRKLTSAGASIKPAADGWSPLSMALHRYGPNTGAVTELLAQGALATFDTHGKWSPLRYALNTYVPCPGMVRLLLRAGADPAEVDPNSVPIIECAYRWTTFVIDHSKKRPKLYGLPPSRWRRSYRRELRQRRKCYALIAMALKQRGQWPPPPASAS